MGKIKEKHPVRRGGTSSAAVIPGGHRAWWSSSIIQLLGMLRQDDLPELQREFKAGSWQTTSFPNVTLIYSGASCGVSSVCFPMHIWASHNKARVWTWWVTPVTQLSGH